MRRFAPAVVFSTVAASGSAWAQGMHDWGMWFGTLLMIAVAGVLVGLGVVLVRSLKRRS